MNDREARLRECRAAVSHTIEVLERELGITPALPMTLALLDVSNQLTRILQADPEPPMFRKRAAGTGA